MNAKMELAVGAAAVLTGAVFLAARHDGGRVLPADFRDAVNSEGAADELRKAVPGGQELNLEVPPPEPEAAQTAGAAAPGVSRVYSQNDPWHRRLAEAVGVRYPCHVETKHLGKFYNNARKLTFDDGRRREAVVVKVFDPLTGAKFLPLEALTLHVPIHLTPGGRFKNTVVMTEKFINAGFKTLDTVLTVPEKRIFVTRFVKGTGGADIQLKALGGDPDALKLVERIGAAYAAAHRSNFTIGDPNPDNIMLVDGELRYADLEQAAVGGSKGYDIAGFFYLPIARDRPQVKRQAWAAVARSYLRGYLAGGGNPGDIKAALRLEYLGPYLSAVLIGALNPIREVRRELKKAAGEDPAQEPEETFEPVP